MTGQAPPACPCPQAARQSGWKPIQGVKYRKHRWHVSPRTQWIAATERAETTAQLALSLRQLEPMLLVRQAASGLGDRCLAAGMAGLGVTPPDQAVPLRWHCPCAAH